MFFKKLLKTELRAQYYELDVSPYINLNGHPAPQGPASWSLQSHIPCLPLLLPLTRQVSSVLLPSTTQMHPLRSKSTATILVRDIVPLVWSPRVS